MNVDIDEIKSRIYETDWSDCAAGCAGCMASICMTMGCIGFIALPYMPFSSNTESFSVIYTYMILLMIAFLIAVCGFLGESRSCICTGLVLGLFAFVFWLALTLPSLMKYSNDWFHPYCLGPHCGETHWLAPRAWKDSGQTYPTYFPPHPYVDYSSDARRKSQLLPDTSHINEFPQNSQETGPGMLPRRNEFPQNSIETGPGMLSRMNEFPPNFQGTHPSILFPNRSSSNEMYRKSMPFNIRTSSARARSELDHFKTLVEHGRFHIRHKRQEINSEYLRNKKFRPITHSTVTLNFFISIFYTLIYACMFLCTLGLLFNKLVQMGCHNLEEHNMEFFSGDNCNMASNCDMNCNNNNTESFDDNC